MSDNRFKKDETVKVSQEELSVWYSTLDKIEMQITRIMLIRRKSKGKRVSSPRRSVAMMVASAVILCSWSFSDYEKWMTLSSVIVGLTVYFMVIKFLPLPSNEQEQMVHLLKTAKLPTYSIVTGVNVSAEDSPEVIEEKILAVIKKEKQQIQSLQEPSLSPSK